MDNSRPKINFNKKVDDILNDYSVLISTVQQHQSIVDLADKIYEKLGLDKVVICSLIYQVIIQSQEEKQRFHFEVENLLPQIRLNLKTQQAENLKKSLHKLLLIKSDADYVNQIVDDLFDWYIYEYLSE